mmetsp:Transcript_16161/g.26380  ORF Transcript_16161/g.26380 Transcript_16161/m.26380 type:complete len:192 (+) Transcript_16161:1228-1803(+)
MGQVLDCFQEETPVDNVLVASATLDIKWKNDSVELGNNFTCISGEGCCLVNAALHQDKCYFEISIAKLPAGSSFCVGVAKRDKAVLGNIELGDGERSWAFKSTQSTESFKEGDIIGCVWDQSSGRPQMSLRLNGDKLPPGTEVKGFKGVLYPAISVSHGCELVCNFSLEDEGFASPPPNGFAGLIPSRSMI